MFEFKPPQERWMLFVVPENELTEELCMNAVRIDGRSLQYVPPHMRSREMCLTAVGNNCHALAHVYITPHLDRELCMVAVTADGMALQYVPYEFLDEEVCKAAVLQNRLAIEFVPDALKSCAREIADAAWDVAEGKQKKAFNRAIRLLEQSMED